ncbi:hypothetical protein QBC46DRAFT_404177 [Diplogelasinospora grovesii]|uniref:Uncharacterized protein n=1 Tax=Diplogelasinospora grovesii TaxID=303347 RepID=A0AAN6S849_9PEZI|nr:hypothetical protein QBC46DRAFT_404177 [Diplogelasinospora grovesii]
MSHDHELDYWYSEHRDIAQELEQLGLLVNGHICGWSMCPAVMSTQALELATREKKSKGGDRRKWREKEANGKTYNTRDSLVVTDPTTDLALSGLSMGERTGSRVFQWVWSYATIFGCSTTISTDSHYCMYVRLSGSMAAAKSLPIAAACLNNLQHMQISNRWGKLDDATPTRFQTESEAIITGWWTHTTAGGLQTRLLRCRRLLARALRLLCCFVAHKTDY